MKENEQKIEQNVNELNEEDMEQVQGGLLRKPYVPKNSDEKAKSAANQAEAGGPLRFFLQNLADYVKKNLMCFVCLEAKIAQI